VNAGGRSPARTVVTLLTALSLFAYVLRMNISVAAPYMMADLGLDKIQMGRVFSAFMLGYALFQIPWGAWGDRIGPGRVLTAAVLVWSATTLLTGLVPGWVVPAGGAALAVLMAIRFLLGVGEAAIYPVAARAVAGWLPETSRAAAYSSLIVGASVGSAFTPPIVSWVMVTAGWRASFALGAALALGLAIVWHRAVGARLDREAAGGGGGGASPSRSWMSVLRNRNVAIMSVSYFLDSYVVFIFVFWLYTYLVEQRGFSILQSGFYTGLPFMVAIVLVPGAGYLSDALCRRLGRSWGRRLVAMAGLVLSAAFLLVGVDVTSSLQAVAGLSLAVGFLFCTEPAYWGASMDLGGAEAGTTGGIMNMAGNLGGVVSTALVPVLVAHFGWRLAFGSAAGLAVVAALLWLLVRVESVAAGEA
jgi:MFS transporter, ACS family, glucarate transporter